MRQSLVTSIVAICAFTSSASAQSPDYCSVALTEQAYDRVSSSIKTNIAFSARDALCDKEYNNIGEAQSAARNRGFSLGYSGLEIGANEAKQSSNGKWDIKETSFCKASASDLQSSFQQDYESQIANVAVTSWLECVKSSNQNALYIDYEVSKDGQYFTGTLHATANTGSFERRITGISVVGPAASTVKCNIGGRSYRPNDAQKDPIEVKSTGTAIACDKSSNEGASIAFQTSQGSLPFIKLLSEVEIKVGEFEELETRLKALFAKVDADSKISSSGIDAIKASLDNTNTAIDGRFNRIRLTKACVTREHNNCEPWNAPPACPAGFRNTGLTEENYWGGGRCGQGSYCVVCYADSP